METIQQQMVEAKKIERADALKKVKRLCREFVFTAGTLRGSLARIDATDTFVAIAKVP